MATAGSRRGIVTHNILDYQAVPNDESTFEMEFENAAALMYALQDASEQSVDGLIHEVLIPEGYWFSMMPIQSYNIANVTLRIDGEIKVSKRHTRFPVIYHFKGWDGKQWDNKLWSVFFFEGVTNFRIVGKG